MCYGCYRFFLTLTFTHTHIHNQRGQFNFETIRNGWSVTATSNRTRNMCKKKLLICFEYSHTDTQFDQHAHLQGARLFIYHIAYIEWAFNIRSYHIERDKVTIMVHRFLSVVFFLFVAFFFTHILFMFRYGLVLWLKAWRQIKEGLFLFSATFFLYSPPPSNMYSFNLSVPCRERLDGFFCVIPFSSSGQWSTKKHFVLHGYQIKLTITYLLLKQILIHNQTNKNLQFNIG